MPFRRFRRVLVAIAAAAAAVVASPALAEVPDYSFTPLAKNAASAARPYPKYRFMFGSPARWPASTVRWRYNHANAPSPFDSDPAGTLAQVRSALEAWSGVCGIRYVYEGDTAIAPDARVDHPVFGEQPDLVNVVGWGPLDGTTVGVAQVWYDSDAGELLDSDIILSTSRVSSTLEMQRTATHEWGHAIGLAHSNLFGALMSGPPDTQYNNLRSVQTDDTRGCRCLYGAAAGNPAGFSCSLPTRIDLGDVPVNGSSAPRVVPLANDGDAPLTVTGVTVSSLRVSIEGSCAAGLVLQPGQGCAMTLLARPEFQFAFDELVTFGTSDGDYNVPVRFNGVPGSVSATVVQLVEYFHAGFGHYFVTHLAEEIARLDDGRFAGWARTGRTINAWAQASAGAVPVCRFFSARFAPKSSHFYTSFGTECQTVKGNADWTFEGEVFYVALPEATGTCPGATLPVYRLYNESASGAPNHRFTTDAALRTQMIAQGWTPEGLGVGITMCTPA